MRREIKQMDHLWEANIRKVTPYVPGEQPDTSNIIKLNANENPYPPSPEVEKALRLMDADTLGRYPDSACTGLVEALAREKGLSPDQVFTGVGSDEVLALCFLTFFNSKAPLLFPDITYSFYDVWAELFRIPYQTIPLDEQFQIRPEDYALPCGGVIFPNPNAPTGRLLEEERIRRILDAHRDVIVIVDEAYIDFGGRSVVPLLETYDNLVVVQTFSKSRSLAGMRIGAAFAGPKLISFLRDVKYSFNSFTMNVPALAAGEAALRDRAYFERVIAKIAATRARVSERLRGLGFVFADSAANFLFVTHPEYSARELFDALRKRGIYVRYFNRPRIDRYLRITIGTDEEMDALLKALEDLLA